MLTGIVAILFWITLVGAISTYVALVFGQFWNKPANHTPLFSPYRK